MLEIRKFCYFTCSNNNYGSQWCHRCYHQLGNAHCRFDHASGRLAEDNDGGSAASVWNSLMRNNPLDIWWKLLKKWFFVTKKYSCTFEFAVALLHYSLFDVFKILQLNHGFCEKVNHKKYKLLPEMLFALHYWSN